MCFPPFCQPARHVLGCFSLRQGAAAVLVINGTYGLCLVVVHALLLGGEEGTGSEVMRPSSLSALSSGGAVAGAGSSFGRALQAPKEDGFDWLLQMLDLDVSWGHRLLGFDNHTNLVSGLIYGIVVTLACMYMFHAVQNRGALLPTHARWFVAFMNIEIILYVGLVLVKLPKLCIIQETYLPALYMECTVLRFLFLERVAITVFAASLCTWIFASFAFLLTFGHGAMSAVDRPEFAQELDLLHHMENGGAVGPTPSGPPGGARAPLGGAAASRLQSSAQLALADSRHNVGGGYGPSSMSHHYANSMRSGGHASSMRSGPPRTSYSIGHMPRASSSMVTSSDHSETSHLIRPPVAVY